MDDMEPGGGMDNTSGDGCDGGESFLRKDAIALSRL